MFDSLLYSTESQKTSNNTNRQLIENIILKTINTLDPGGSNSERYKKYFSELTDTQFESYMHGIKEGKIRLILYVPNLKLNLKLSNIFKAAKDIGLQLWERISLWDNTTQRYYLTPHSYPILMLPVRRLKQTLVSKISVPESDAKIDSFSGQVVKPDKGSSISSVEMQTILSKGLKMSISELIRVRGGDISSYSEFKSQLEETGTASLNDLSNESRARSSVILSVYLRSMHIDNNL